MFLHPECVCICECPILFQKICIMFDFFHRFVPDLEDIVSFEELTTEAKLGEETTNAARYVSTKST